MARTFQFQDKKQAMSPKEEPLPNQPERSIPTKPDPNPDPSRKVPEKNDPTRIPDPSKADPTRIAPDPTKPPKS